MKRVVVTGIGALTPIGNSFSEYAEALKVGKSGGATITRFDASKFRCTFGCELKDFDATLRISAKETRRADLFSQYALYSTAEAIEDSGVDFEQLDRTRIGVIWGSGIGGLRSLEQEIEFNTDYEKDPKYSPLMIPKMIADIAPGLISMKYGLMGINYGAVSACASSCHAMINALDYIRLGKADMIVTGGSEAAITRAGIGGFGSMKALSTRNDDPATASRPFDKNRDGFVLGEGSGTLILEEYEHAKRRGAKIYAEILGGGATADAHHMTAPHPEGLGAANAMEMAMQDAQINADQVDYINVHCTSTPLGDIAEIRALTRVFGDGLYSKNISSTKSMTGHLLGASGAIEAIACIVALRDGVIPPTINNEELDDVFDPKLNLTLNKAQERQVEFAVCNTFGFGGHNTSVVFKRF